MWPGAVLSTIASLRAVKQPRHAPDELDLERHALFDEVVARQHLLEGGLDPGRLYGGEVTHPSQVHS